jgi:hypothetical protein
MLFSVTKGIVSAVGEFPSAGSGTWIQTETPIHPATASLIHLSTAIAHRSREETLTGVTLAAAFLFLASVGKHPPLAPRTTECNRKKKAGRPMNALL